MMRGTVSLKGNGTEPSEGRRAVQVSLDLNNLEADLDLVVIHQQGQIKATQTLFIDSADNDFAITMVYSGTNQRIVVPPNSQGYYNPLLPNPPIIHFSSPEAVILNLQVLNFMIEPVVWKVAESGGGMGTVTSVGLALPSEFDVTGSPVTTAGTLDATWNVQAAHDVFAAPVAGGTPSFRLLVAADIPALGYVQTVAGTANQISSSGGVNPALSFPAAVTMPGSLAMVGAFAPAQLAGIIGTTTNNNANAGSVGEYIHSDVLLAAPLPGVVSGTPFNLTSIALTPGDWDVWCNIVFLTSTQTLTTSEACVNTVTATLSDAAFRGIISAIAAAGASGGAVSPVQRISIAANTTIFAVGFCAFTGGGTLSACGFIGARRVR